MGPAAGINGAATACRCHMCNVAAVSRDLLCRGCTPVHCMLDRRVCHTTYLQGAAAAWACVIDACRHCYAAPAALAQTVTGCGTRCGKGCKPCIVCIVCSWYNWPSRQLLHQAVNLTHGFVSMTCKFWPAAVAAEQQPATAASASCADVCAVSTMCVCQRLVAIKPAIAV